MFCYIMTESKRVNLALRQDREYVLLFLLIKDKLPLILPADRLPGTVLICPSKAPYSAQHLKMELVVQQATVRGELDETPIGTTFLISQIFDAGINL